MGTDYVLLDSAPTHKSCLGLHLQFPVVGWLDGCARAQPRLLKGFQVELGNQVKAVSPDTIVIFRHHIHHQQPYLDRAGISDEEADASALEFIYLFSNSVNQHGGVDVAESLCETYPSHNWEAQRKAIAFDRAFIRMLPLVCPGVVAGVFTAPIGNPDHHEFHILLELAADAQAAGAYFCYHAYWPVYHEESYVNDANVAHNLHMRWNSIDAYLVQHGIRVKWMLGEIGAIGCAHPDLWPTHGYCLNAGAGWKHPDVWNDNYLAYLQDLIDFDQLLLGTVARSEGRLVGGTIFTSGPGWEHFQVVQPLLDDLCDYIALVHVPVLAHHRVISDYVNVRSAPRVAGDTWIGRIPRDFALIPHEMLVNGPDTWVRSGLGWVAKKYAGRTYLEEV